MPWIAIDPGIMGGILAFREPDIWDFRKMPILEIGLKTRSRHFRAVKSLSQASRIKAIAERDELSDRPISRAAGTTVAKSTKKGPRVRRVLDARAAAKILSDFPGGVVLEAQHPIRGQGLTSTASIMRQFGQLEGVLCGLGRSYEIMDARTWQHALGVTGTKANAWVVMQRAQPALADSVQRLPEASRVACADCWCMIQTMLRSRPTDDWLSA